jgi:hypothetical protein
MTTILNGFGRTLGDGIIGLQALTIAIESQTIAPQPVLRRLGGVSPIINELYHAAGDFASLQNLPWRFEKPGLTPPLIVSRIIDLRDFAHDPQFRGVAMIDYFLERLAVDPAEIPSSRKRNSWLAKRVLPVPPDCVGGYVLLCPSASMQLRCMPALVHETVCRWLMRNTRLPVVTQFTRSNEPTLGHLCGLVASAALVVSADTAMVHLADAFSVPCLAFFPTHRPVWRTRDYPLCHSVQLVTNELPEALEFSRGIADDNAAVNAWFPHGTDLGWLENLLAAAVDRLGISPTRVSQEHRAT